MTAGENPEKESTVEDEDDGIEQEARHIEHEALVDPLLAIVKLYGRQLVPEVVLNALEQDANEL